MNGDAPLFEWEVRFSRTEKDDSQISCEMWSCTIIAENEEEIREAAAEEFPGAVIESIKLLGGAE